ncbi:hypothetical protein JTE90_018911 [Oedothorax gibbosus]|uniref:Uncharacterized protein n=1 Tax=Oedothorax gibbosus TaxID=931172 RepID=A0AAV6VUC1_9ARAC|nr:hypothetical protein JTE90_018911 [Oedothorax gibbosus]
MTPKRDQFIHPVVSSSTKCFLVNSLKCIVALRPFSRVYHIVAVEHISFQTPQLIDEVKQVKIYRWKLEHCTNCKGKFMPKMSTYGLFL